MSFESSVSAFLATEETQNQRSYGTSVPGYV